MIAITETTKAFAMAERIAGNELQKAYPDVPVVKQWYTNQDDLVCDICGPLAGKEVPLTSLFAGDIEQPPAHVRCRCWMSTSTRIGAEWDEGGATIPNNITINASGISQETRDRIGATLNNLNDKNPLYLSNIKTIEYLPEDTFEVARYLGNGRMGINPAYFNDISALERAMSYEPGFFVSGVDDAVQNIITHETGHSFDSYITRELLDPEFNPNITIQDRYDFLDKMSAAYKNNYDSMPSRYSLTTGREAFAEAFVEIVQKPKSQWSGYSAEVYKILKGVLP